MTQASEFIDVIDEPKRARVLLEETRMTLLQNLSEPSSPSALAARLDLPRQRVNYHLKELASQNLIVLVSEKIKGNVRERIYRRTGDSYAISSAALGPLGSSTSQIKDRFSSAYQIALASQAVRDLGAMQVDAQAAGQTLATLSLDVKVRFASAEKRNQFSEELAAALADLVRKYQDDEAPTGRSFQFYMGAYPTPKGD